MNQTKESDAPTGVLKAYNRTWDGLYTLMNMVELTDNPELKYMCRDFGRTLTDKLTRDYPTFWSNLVNHNQPA